jgi:hypothetical protein
MKLVRYTCGSCGETFETEQWDRTPQFRECPSEPCARNPRGKGHLRCTLVRGEDNPWLDRTPFVLKSLTYTLHEDARFKWGCLVAVLLVVAGFLLTIKAIPVDSPSSAESHVKLSAVSLLNLHWHRRMAERYAADERKTEAVEQLIQALMVNRFDRESSRSLLRLIEGMPSVKPGLVRLGVAQSERLLGFDDRTPADLAMVARFYESADLIRMAYTGDRRLIGGLAESEAAKFPVPTWPGPRLTKSIKSQFTEDSADLPVELGLQLYRVFFESGAQERFEKLWARKIPGLNELGEALLYRWAWDAMGRDNRGLESGLKELRIAALNPSGACVREANHVLVRVYSSIHEIPEAEAALSRLTTMGNDSMTDHLLVVRSMARRREGNDSDRAAAIYGEIVTSAQSVSEAILQLEACHDLGRDEHLMELLDSDLPDFNYSPELCLTGIRLLHEAGMASELANIGLHFRELGGIDKRIREYGYFATGMSELLRGNRTRATPSLERFVSSGAVDPIFAPRVASQLKSLGFPRLAASLTEPSVFPQDSGTQTAAALVR